MFSANFIAESSAPCGSYVLVDDLEHVGAFVMIAKVVDPTDKASLQRGAQLYMNYCLGLPFA